MLIYVVKATLRDAEAEADFIRWLGEDGHIEEVVRCGGALTGRIIRVDAEAAAEGGGEQQPQVHVEYEFPDRAAFDGYTRDHAPRLREEGIRLFTETGKVVKFERTIGEVSFAFDAREAGDVDDGGDGEGGKVQG